MLPLALSAATTTPAHAPAARGGGARRAEGAGFPAALLAGVVPIAGDAKAAAGETADAVTDQDGQIAAADGKVVPDAVAADPLAWLATMALPLPMVAASAVVTPAAAAPVASAAVAVQASAAALMPEPAIAAGTTADDAAIAAAPVLSPPAPGGNPVVQPAARPTAMPAALSDDLAAQIKAGQLTPATGLPFAADPSLATVTGPVVIETAPATTPPRAEPAIVAPGSSLASTAAMPVPLQPGTTAPAAQVFAAAIRASTKDDDRDRAPTTGDAAATPTLTAAAMDTGTHAVAATGDTAAQSSLDMRQERWPHAMVDHIERLRDDADAADTRIRLVPDALGSIDVSVRRDGDTLHVHFAAEQAATRTLLADAQPRLADIAESRGLKLGQADIGGGASDQRQSQSGAQNRSTAPTPAAPRSAFAAAVEAASTDTRIA